MNKEGTLLITGSVELTIFLYCLRQNKGVVTLVPIGFIPVPSQITCFLWHPNEVKMSLCVLLLVFNFCFYAGEYFVRWYFVWRNITV